MRTMTCNRCFRTVPVAPSYFNVTVPHLPTAGSPMRTNASGTASTILMCDGNEKRKWRDDLEHPAMRLARQQEVLADDAYWEGL